MLRAYRRVLTVSLPLAASNAVLLVMEFTDRMFLANYDLDAIAAALPAGILAYLALLIFNETARYISVFIAQYKGAGLMENVGRSLWHGIYFAMFSGMGLALISFAAPFFFTLAGHDPAVRRLEEIYFRILCLGGGVSVLTTAFSAFFTGIGQTRVILMVHVFTMLFNIPLDYALINGAWGLPEMGIAGAACATLTAAGLGGICFGLLIFGPRRYRVYRVRIPVRPDMVLIKKLLRYGVPGSLHFLMDVAAFTFFIFMVGRIGRNELAVTNIIMTISALAFIPTQGFALGASTLVGFCLGRGNSLEAKSLTRQTLHLGYIYIFLLSIVLILFPHAIIDIFKPRGLAPGNFEIIHQMGGGLIRFVTFYILFDAQYLILSGALKGAGDTGFIMWSILIAAFFVMVLPIYIGLTFFDAGLYFAWACTSGFIFCLFVITVLRFRSGVWEHIRIIQR